jgi:alpha-glucosidase (family GH31 glycosyl hydrolase)
MIINLLFLLCMTAISSGFGGHSLTHSDIGGYNAEMHLNDSDSSSANMTYIRTPELLKRWTEMAAFGFGEWLANAVVV